MSNKNAITIALLIASLAVAGVAAVQAAENADVTWNGSIQIDATPAADGSSFTYDVTDVDSVSNFTVNVTGHTASEWDNESAGRVLTSSSQSINVGGNIQPIGPSSGEPELTVSAHVKKYTGADSSDWNTLTLYGDDGDVWNSSNTFPLPSSSAGYIDGLRAFDSWPGAGGSADIDIYVSCGDADSTFREGTKALDGWTPSNAGEYVGFPSPVDVSSCRGGNIEIEFMTNSATARGEMMHHTSTCSGSRFLEGGGGSDQSYCAEFYAEEASPGGVSVSAGDGTSKSIGDIAKGGSTSVSLDISESATKLDWSGSYDAAIDWSLDFEERTATEDPTVEVNGQTTSHTGTLSDGQETNLSTDPSWIKSGTNRVNVSASSPGGDAPTPQVDLDYDHQAVDEVTVDYTAEEWTERYRYSRKFAASQSNVHTQVPFVKTVYSVRDIEEKTNSGDWGPVGVADYSFSGTELDVDVGSVSSGDTVYVRANASKAKVSNGAISVENPTKEGNSLDTRFTIDSKSQGFGIQVNGSSNDGRTHRLYDTSWGDDGYVLEKANGLQELKAPNAAAGDSATVETIALRTEPQTGEVQVDVVSPADPMQINVTPGSNTGDSIDWVYTDTISGYEYELYDKTNGKVLDSATAQSPVTLTSDDSDLLLEFLQGDGSGTSSSSSGGGGSGGGDSGGQQAGGLTLPLLALAAMLGLGGLYVVQQRFGGSGSSSGSTSSSSSGIMGRLKGALSGPLVVIGAVVLIVLFASFGLAQPLMTALASGDGGGGILLLAAVAGIFGVAWYYTRSMAILVTGSVAIVVLAGDIVTGGGVFPTIAEGIGDSFALIALLGFGALYLWYRNRDSDSPTITIRGSDE